MYTCSSQTLVHLSALGCFWWSVMLLLLFLIFYISRRVFFYFYFFSFLSVDLFVLLSPSTWLIWTSDVCLFSLSLSCWFVRPLLSLWAVSGFIRHPAGSARGAAALWPIWAVWPFFLLYAVVVDLWSFCFGSCIIPFFFSFFFFLSIWQTQQRTVAWLSKWVVNSFTQSAKCCSLVNKRNNAPFQPRGSALLILCCKRIWRVMALVWCWTGLDQNCGRGAWAERKGSTRGCTPKVRAVCNLWVVISK